MLMSSDKKILYLVGQENIHKKPLPPFDNTICEFLNDLSSKIDKSKEVIAFC